jgi:hypothetical protein
VEVVRGWPEGLSHGKASPAATYFFNLPTLFTNPIKIEGQEDFLTLQELRWIGSEIERKLDYTFILGSDLSKPVVVEFSYGDYNGSYSISAHDIQAGAGRVFSMLFHIARRIGEDRRLPDEVKIIVFDGIYRSLAEQSMVGFAKSLEELSRYNISAYFESPATSLGSYENETAAEQLLYPSREHGMIVGVSKTLLESRLEEEHALIGPATDDPYGEYYRTLDFFVEMGYATEIRTPTGIYIFPTRKLLDNQKVPA